MRTELELSKCPTCEHALDAASAVEGEATPREGDLSVCLYCGEILEFAENMKPVKADIEAIIQTDFIQLQRAQQIVRAFRERIKT